jgi:hypothetical protein
VHKLRILEKDLFYSKAREAGFSQAIHLPDRFRQELAIAKKNV